MPGMRCIGLVGRYEILGIVFNISSLTSIFGYLEKRHAHHFLIAWLAMWMHMYMYMYVGGGLLLTSFCST